MTNSNIIFVGLKYLHDYGISHGDIHLGNVLIFKNNDNIVAKWTDFGLAYVTSKNQFKYMTKYSNEESVAIGNRFKTDCEKFGTVLENIWENLKRRTVRKSQLPLVERHKQLVGAMKRAFHLDQVLEKFPDLDLVIAYEESVSEAEESFNYELS